MNALKQPLTPLITELETDEMAPQIEPLSPSPRPAEQAPQALGPTGSQLKLEDLPPPTTRRWVARRKAEVVAAVRGGLLSAEDACQLYSLSADEYASWERLFEKHGMKGLQTTRTQIYRNIDARQEKRKRKAELLRQIQDEVPLTH